MLWGFARNGIPTLMWLNVKRRHLTKTLCFYFRDQTGVCHVLNWKKKVWETPEFKAEAEDKWVLLLADFPQKKGDPEPVNINDPKIILAEKFNRDGFFPFFVVLDKNGRLLGKRGYEGLDTAQEYIALFEKLSR